MQFFGELSSPLLEVRILALDHVRCTLTMPFPLAHRALQNPELFRSEHYRQAALAVLAGIVIRAIVAIPVSTFRRTC